MTSTEGAAADIKDRLKAKIFISYSRKDAAFADRLEAGLKALEFSTLIDRTEIYALEDWWKRVEDLIAQADTVVFVVSPDAVGSSICQREVNFAASLNKRLAPVLYRQVESQAVPEALARLNFVFFDDEASFEASLHHLAEALDTNITWVRKHTEFSDHARRWEAAGRPGPRGLLLRSPVLEDAEQWIATRPPGGPQPTAVTQAFIAESRRAATRRRNAISLGLGAGIVVALVLAGFAYWQRGVAVEQRSLAERNEKQANEQRGLANDRRDRALLTQSRFLVDLARQQLLDNDFATASLLAIEALPAEDASRPYLPEAEDVLTRAQRQISESSLFSGVAGDIRNTTFSPSGRYIAGSWKDIGFVIEATTGKEVVGLKGHEGEIRSISFSSDGKRLITASDDKTARIWDVANGNELLVLRGHLTGLKCATFSPDGRRVATTAGAAFVDDGDDMDNTARIWDAGTGRQIVVLRGHSGEVNSAAFSPDGRSVVTAADDWTIRLWESNTGKALREMRGHEQKRIGSAVFTPNGKSVLSVSDDQTARLWNVKTGKQELVLKGHGARINTGVVSRDNSRVLTASDDQTARVWDAASGAQLFVLRGQLEAVSYASFSPDGRQVVTSGLEHPTRMWDISEAIANSTIILHSIAANAVAFSPDGSRIVAGAFLGTSAPVVDSTSGADVFVLNGHQDAINSAVYNAAGSKIVTAARDRTARLWDARRGTLDFLLRGHTASVNSAVFNAEGSTIVTASDDGTARLWNVSTGEEVRLLQGHTGEVKSAVFSPDGRTILTASTDRTARIWDVQSGRQLQQLEHADALISAVFSPDGQSAAITSRDQTIRIWDVVGMQVLRILEGSGGGSGAVTAGMFSPDGARIVSTVTNYTKGTSAVWVWNAETGEKIYSLPSSESSLSAAAINFDGSRLAVVGLDGSIMISAIYRSTQELLENVERRVPRCLSAPQRESASLDPAEPSWCTRMGKWPSSMVAKK